MGLVLVGRLSSNVDVDLINRIFIFCECIRKRQVAPV